MMAENSKIEWTDHTFNPWMGCTKVSDGCKHCYAETMMDHRYGKVKWGPQGKRVRTAKQYWKQPLKWNETRFVECEVCGLRQVFNEHGRCPGCEHPMVAAMRWVRQRVFCASLADVFEEKQDQLEEMNRWRADLFGMIEETPNLDWLLLTKRPRNFSRMIHDRWYASSPRNIWAGISVENQEAACERVQYLAEIPASVSFLSVEPMLGPVDLTKPVWNNGVAMIEHVDWVICGGESGPDARPMNPDWARSLRDQCQEADVPFFFKQWGEWVPLAEEFDTNAIGDVGKFDTKNKYWQWAEHGDSQRHVSIRIGKHSAGRVLDGREWSEFPK
jgi:Bacteriophage protein gp37